MSSTTGRFQFALNQFNTSMFRCPQVWTHFYEVWTHTPVYSAQPWGQAYNQYGYYSPYTMIYLCNFMMWDAVYQRQLGPSTRAHDVVHDVMTTRFDKHFDACDPARCT